MKAKKSILALLLLAAASTSMFLGCGKHDPYVLDGINWDGSNSGTLELVNGSAKDFVLFVGQSPAPSNLLGGVRAGATVKHDISKHVSDFAIGGYAVVRGISKEEYDKSYDLSNAKIEYNALITYKGGQVFRYNIDPNFMGNNGFKVTNRLDIGVELRKNSPEGEKIAYLPRRAQRQMVYTQNRELITLFPVYVFFNKTTGEVSTLEASSIFQSVTVMPEQLGPSNATITNYDVPNDASLTWDAIVGTLKQPVAYVTFISNIVNQVGAVTRAGGQPLLSQSGDEGIGSGQSQVFEVKSTEEGAEIDLRVKYYGGDIQIPVKVAGEDDLPIIKNGYNYTVTINYKDTNGDGIKNKANYTAKIEDKGKRNISDQITSP